MKSLLFIEIGCNIFTGFQIFAIKTVNHTYKNNKTKCPVCVYDYVDVSVLQCVCAIMYIILDMH